jgi:hypothetical protein
MKENIWSFNLHFNNLTIEQVDECPSETASDTQMCLALPWIALPMH